MTEYRLEDCNSRIKINVEDYSNIKSDGSAIYCDKNMTDTAASIVYAEKESEVEVSIIGPLASHYYKLNSKNSSPITILLQNYNFCMEISEEDLKRIIHVMANSLLATAYYTNLQIKIIIQVYANGPEIISCVLNGVLAAIHRAGLHIKNPALAFTLAIQNQNIILNSIPPIAETEGVGIFVIDPYFKENILVFETIKGFPIELLLEKWTEITQEAVLQLMTIRQSLLD